MTSSKVSPTSSGAKEIGVKPCNYYALISGLVALPVIMLTELLYRDALYDAPEFRSITMISDNVSENVQKAFVYFTNTGGGVTLALYTLLLGIGSLNRVKFLYYLLLSSVTVYVMNITKMLYKHDRPMWVNPDVSTSAITKCSSNYGNPSGHSMVASAIAFTVLCDILEHLKTYKN